MIDQANFPIRVNSQLTQLKCCGLITNEKVTLHVLISRISGFDLADAPGWLPAYFVGPAAAAVRAGLAGAPISALGGKVLEGWRVSETSGASAYDPRAVETPVYRQGNIGRLHLTLGDRHWEPPQISGHWCVRPGDVVLNKLAPVRAAFVSPHAKRHPVDGNSLIVRALPAPTAAWLAVCLNDPGYQQLLLMESGVLRRVGLRALTSFRIPPVPVQMEGLSARLRDILDQQILTGDALNRVRNEANAETGDASPKVQNLGSGAFFSCDAVTNDSWLPTTTALRAEQTSLADDLGWTAVGELALFDERLRLSHAPEAARALRLSDVGDDLFVPALDGPPSSEIIPSRTLAKPLVPGEVLLSTVGSSFRAAYVDDDVSPNTFPADGWVRLRFRETPAAWALLLSTEPLRSQAARLAVGSVQQFVPPDALRSLRVPTPPREVRDHWQRAVERHHAQRHSLDLQWSALVSDLSAVFDAVHRPFGNTTVHAREVLQ